MSTLLSPNLFVSVNGFQCVGERSLRQAEVTIDEEAHGGTPRPLSRRSSSEGSVRGSHRRTSLYFTDRAPTGTLSKSFWSLGGRTGVERVSGTRTVVPQGTTVRNDGRLLFDDRHRNQTYNLRPHIQDPPYLSSSQAGRGSSYSSEIKFYL